MVKKIFESKIVNIFTWIIFFLFFCFFFARLWLHFVWNTNLFCRLNFWKEFYLITHWILVDKDAIKHSYASFSTGKKNIVLINRASFLFSNTYLKNIVQSSCFFKNQIMMTEYKTNSFPLPLPWRRTLR